MGVWWPATPSTTKYKHNCVRCFQTRKHTHTENLIGPPARVISDFENSLWPLISVLVEPLDPLGEGDGLLHSVEAVVGIAVLAALRGEPLVQRWAAQRLTDLCDRGVPVGATLPQQKSVSI